MKLEKSKTHIVLSLTKKEMATLIAGLECFISFGVPGGYEDVGRFFEQLNKRNWAMESKNETRKT